MTIFVSGAKPTLKGGSKSVALRNVVIWKMDDVFEVMVEGGANQQGGKGDYLVYDEKTEVLSVVSPLELERDYGEVVKSPAKAKKGGK